jgi:5-methylcytosine-specific restriction endonuclease McrA
MYGNFKTEQKYYRAMVIDSNNREENDFKRRPSDDSNDKNRQIPLVDKLIVWNESCTHPDFDPELFKSDYIGCIVLKGLTTCNTVTGTFRRKLAYEFEHLVPHSQGGRSDFNNVVILNAGINRSKGNRHSIKDMNFYEIQGYIAWFGVKFEDLKHELDEDLHRTCVKYDLTFFKTNNDFWSVKTDGNEYLSYDNKHNYLPIRTNIDYPHIPSSDQDSTIEKILKIIGFLEVMYAFGVIYYKVLKPIIEKLIADFKEVAKNSKILENSIKEQIRVKTDENAKNGIPQEKEKLTEIFHDIGLVIYGFFINQNHLVYENKLHRLQNPRKQIEIEILFDCSETKN